MAMEPLQPTLQHLEEKIKKTVLAHRGSLSGKWQDMIHRMNCETALSIYCDCSVISGEFHLGVCIVGAGVCKLFGKTLNTQCPELTVVGELKALIFAIECAQEFTINGGYDTIKSITFFSDVDHIQQLLTSNTLRTRPPILSSVQELNIYIRRFPAVCPGTRIYINYLGNVAQKNNIYYNTAHNVARKVARRHVHE